MSKWVKGHLIHRHKRSRADGYPPDLAWPQPAALEAGCQFPSQRLKSDCGSESITRPRSEQLCRKWTSTKKWKVVKQVKCLSGERRVNVNRHTGELRESHALLVVWIAYMGHLFWVSVGRSSCFAWFWVCIWFTSGSSPVCTCIS